MKRTNRYEDSRSSQAQLIDRFVPDTQLLFVKPVLSRNLTKLEKFDTTENKRSSQFSQRQCGDMVKAEKCDAFENILSSQFSQRQYHRSGIVPADQPPSVTPITGELLRELMASRTPTQLNCNRDPSRKELQDNSTDNGNLHSRSKCSESSPVETQNITSYAPHCTSVSANIADVEKRHHRANMWDIKWHNTYKCAHCNFSTSSPALLDEHMNSHPERDSYQCPLCNPTISFNTISVLQCHVTVGHPGEQPWKCAACGYQTAYLEEFMDHELLHGKVKLSLIAAV